MKTMRINFNKTVDTFLAKGEKTAKPLNAFNINTLQPYFRNAMKVKVFRRAIG